MSETDALALVFWLSGAALATIAWAMIGWAVANRAPRTPVRKRRPAYWTDDEEAGTHNPP